MVQEEFCRRLSLRSVILWCSLWFWLSLSYSFYLVRLWGHGRVLEPGPDAYRWRKAAYIPECNASSGQGPSWASEGSVSCSRVPWQRCEDLTLPKVYLVFPKPQCCNPGLVFGLIVLLSRFLMFSHYLEELLVHLGILPVTDCRLARPQQDRRPQLWCLLLHTWQLTWCSSAVSS